MPVNKGLRASPDGLLRAIADALPISAVDRSGLGKQLGRAGLSSDSEDSFVRVAGGHQGCQKLRDMLRPSSFHCDIDGGVA